MLHNVKLALLTLLSFDQTRPNAMTRRKGEERGKQTQCNNEVKEIGLEGVYKQW